MALNPQVKTLLEQLAQMVPAPDFAKLDPAGEADYLRRARSSQLASQKEPVADITDLKIGGTIPARIYRPASARREGCVIHYVHGGGWVAGSLEMHDSTCRALANLTSCVVVGTTYRLAPEHAFPAAADDAFAALRWIAENGREFGWDPHQLVMAGSSAGGNLVASAALRARDLGGPLIALQVLIYPVIDSRQDTRSYQQNAKGYFLTSDQMAWYWEKYAPREEDRRNPYASPAHAASLKGLPPAVVVVAEYDPLLDEGEAYAQRLRADGVRVMLHRADGQIHGFMAMPGMLDDAGRFLKVIAGEIRTELRLPA
jgi:acetyl esterase